MTKQEAEETILDLSGRAELTDSEVELWYRAQEELKCPTRDGKP